MTKKTGKWISDNMWNIIVVALLGVIVWGGKNFMDNQLRFQEKQIEINYELKKANAIFEERYSAISNIVVLNSDVNLTQGVLLLTHSETLVKHEAEIKFLQRYK